MKKNLVLLIILVGIGFFYFWDTERIEKREAAEEAAQKLLVHEKDNIGQIRVERETETIAAKKEGENWVLTSPLDTDGDKTAWDSMARTLGNADKQRTIKSASAELANYGLSEPELKVTVADLDGASPETILFGKKTPTGSQTYITLSSATDEVYTVYNSVKTTADKSLFDLRDKTVLAMEPDEVQRVDVTVGDSHFQMTRTGEREWQISEPMQARADRSKIRSFVTKIKNGKIKEFIDEEPDDLAQYGLVEPATRLVFWIGEAGAESQWSSKGLILGSTSSVSGQLYAKRQGQSNVFAVAPSILSDMPATPDSVRQRKVTDIRSWDVDRFSVARAGEIVFEASKEGSAWMVLRPEEGEAEYSTVSDVLREITNLEIYEFVDDVTDESALGLDSPETVFSMMTDSATAEIALSAPQERNQLEVCYGVRPDPREVYAILIDDASAVFSKVDEVELKEEEPAEEEGEEETES